MLSSSHKRYQAFLRLQDRIPDSGEMASALEPVQYRFSTGRRQSVASSTSSRDFHPPGISPAAVWATSAAQSLPDGAEQFLWDRHCRHLEDHLPHRARDLRSDLDEFLPQRRQRPVPHRRGNTA